MVFFFNGRKNLIDLTILKNLRASEMAQLVKVLAIKVDDLSSNPGSHMV